MAKKRANGEGSISRRKDGRYEAAVTLSDGRRWRYCARSRDDAAARLLETLHSLQLGQAPPNRLTRLDEYVCSWLSAIEPTVRRTTFDSYTHWAERHIVPQLGTRRITRLTVREVETFLADRLKSGLSPRSVLHIRGVLRKCLADAQRSGLVGQNVAQIARPPRIERRETTVMTGDAASRFVAACASHPLGNLFAFALSTGCRLGECLGLSWADVDIESRAVTIKSQLQRFDGTYQLTPTKSRASRRTLPLSQVAVDALERQRLLQNEAEKKAGELWACPVNGLVFTTEVGNPLNASSVTRRLRRFLRAEGLPELRFHDLRHSCATLLLATGLPLRVVSDVLGHSSPSLTLSTYGHTIPGALDEAAGRMDRVLTGRAAGR